MLANEIIELLDERKRLYGAYISAEPSQYNYYSWFDSIKVAIGVKQPSRHADTQRIDAVLSECKPAIVSAIKADLRAKMIAVDERLKAAGLDVSPEFLAGAKGVPSGESSP